MQSLSPDQPTIAPYLSALASSAPNPGGGSAAGLTAAMSASLVAMVSNLTVGRDAFHTVADVMSSALARAEASVASIQNLIATDEMAFAAVLAAYRLPRDTPPARSVRRNAISDASIRATEPPIAVATCARDLLTLAEIVATHGNPTVVSDAAVAGWLAVGAIRASVVNIRVNLRVIRDPVAVARCQAWITDLLDGIDEQAARIDRVASERCG